MFYISIGFEGEKKVKSRKVWGVSFLIILLCVVCVAVFAFEKKDKKNVTTESVPKIYDFMDVNWVRAGEGDTENLYFASDDSFHYSCACGNPVNDSDLCEGYTYDDKTKTVRLHYFETTESTVTQILIKNYDENSIELDFDGEIRRFEREEE